MCQLFFYKLRFPLQTRSFIQISWKFSTDRPETKFSLRLAVLEIKCSFSVYQSHSLFTRANQTNQDGYLSNCICEHKHSFKVSESTEFKRMVFSLLTRDVGVSQLEATSSVSKTAQASALGCIPEHPFSFQGVQSANLAKSVDLYRVMRVRIWMLSTWQLVRSCCDCWNCCCCIKLLRCYSLKKIMLHLEFVFHMAVSLTWLLHMW